MLYGYTRHVVIALIVFFISCMTGVVLANEKVKITFKVQSQLKVALLPLVRTSSGDIVSQGPELLVVADKKLTEQQPVEWSAMLEKKKAYFLSFYVISDSLYWNCQWSFNPDFLRYTGLTTLKLKLTSKSAPIDCHLELPTK